MNTDTNFMSFENLTKLIEEHKKERHPYKRYEFDNTSYTMLLISINNLIKENKELNKKYLNAVADYETTMSELQELKKENKILRKNAEHNDKVVDKVNWENQLLKKQIKTLDETNIQLISKLDRYDAIVDERDELKNQLTTYQILHRDCKVDNLKNISKIEEKENQQKEFLKYLEDKLCIANEVLDEPEEDGYPADYRVVRNKEKAQQRILDKITDDTILQNKIISAIGSGSWNTEDNTYKPICDNLRQLGFEIIGGLNEKDNNN